VNAGLDFVLTDNVRQKGAIANTSLVKWDVTIDSRAMAPSEIIQHYDYFATRPQAFDRNAAYVSGTSCHQYCHYVSFVCGDRMACS
jgi:hypothetical protein